MNSEQENILNLLISKTQSGQLKWIKELGSNSYEAKVDNYKVEVEANIDMDDLRIIFPGTVIASLKLKDPLNNVFEQIKVFETKSSAYQRICELYRLAQRSHTGADYKLRDFLSKLSD